MIASDFQQQSVDLCRAGGLPAACRDVLHLLRWLHDRGAEHGLDRRRCALFGCSSGGHLVWLLATRATAEAALRRAGHTPELLEVSDGHFAMNAAYPGEPKEFVREAEVLRFLRAHLYGVLCVRAVSPGPSRRR